MGYDRLVPRGYRLFLIAPLVSSVLGCTSFSATGSDAGSGVTADAAPPVQQDASTADGSNGDGGPATPVCNGWTFCDDFEGATFPSALWTARGTSGLLDQAPDLLGSGKALRAQGTAGTAADRYLLASINLPDTFTFALRVRAASSRADFMGNSYVEVVKLECGGGSLRAFGVILDNRGLTLQLDNNNGDFPGFAQDALWHELSVVVGPAVTDVFIDGAHTATPRSFAPRACNLLVGAHAGPLPQPNVDVYVDDIRGK